MYWLEEGKCPDVSASISQSQDGELLMLVYVCRVFSKDWEWRKEHNKAQKHREKATCIIHTSENEELIRAKVSPSLKLPLSMGPCRISQTLKWNLGRFLVYLWGIGSILQQSETISSRHHQLGFLLQTHRSVSGERQAWNTLHWKIEKHGGWVNFQRRKSAAQHNGMHDSPRQSRHWFSHLENHQISWQLKIQSLTFSPLIPFRTYILF